MMCLGLVGCIPFQSAYSRRDGLPSLNPFGMRAIGGNDKIVLRYVLLDQPLGDPYLTAKLWSSTLQPLPPETAALLTENGLRVGVFPSNPPAELLALIDNCDTTMRPHDVTLSNGQEKLLPVNGPIVTSRFREFPQIGSEAILHDLSTAQFGFTVNATRTDDTKLRLSVLPSAQHGVRQGWLRPNRDDTGFSWLDQKKSEQIKSLSWDLKVTPGDFVIIGPTERPVDKVGGAWFVSTETDAPRMRVLVMRVWPGPEVPTTPIPGQKQVRSANKSP